MKVVRKGVSKHIAKVKSGIGLTDNEKLPKDAFDEIWKEIMQEIPSTPGKIDSDHVIARVETVLLDFRSDYRDKIRQLLLKMPLTSRGQNLNIQGPGKHFRFVMKALFESSHDLQPVYNLTSRIFDVAREHLEKKIAEKHNFHPGLIVDLLQLVDNMIDEESKKFEDTITFTSQYRIDVFLVVCGYALPVFQKMVESFRERTDPRMHLERNVKHILLRQFIDQYCLVKAEKACSSVSISPQFSGSHTSDTAVPKVSNTAVYPTATSLKPASSQEMYLRIVRQGVSNRIARIKSTSSDPLPEEVLKAEFDELWKGLMQNIPSNTGKICDIVAEVEIKLLDFKYDYYDKMRQLLLDDKALTKRGQNLKFTPLETKHFKCVGAWKNYVVGSSHSNLQAVINVTNKLFDTARKHLDKKRAEKHNFHPGLIVDLLQLVDNMIDEESKKIEDVITLTSYYRIEVFVTICAYAVPVFQKMAESFLVQTEHLERNVKHVLLRQFIDQCRQVEAEEAIANALCASLEEPIKTQIRGNNMGIIMVRQLKTSESRCFSSKMALKAKILTDLREEDVFESYMEHAQDVSKCLEKRIKDYVVKFSNERSKGKVQTRLQLAAKSEVTRLLQLIEQKVFQVEECNIWEWLLKFCKLCNEQFKEEVVVKLRAADLLKGYDKEHELNLDNFRDTVRDGLHRLMQKLHQTFENISCEVEMKFWSNQPHEILKDLIGCTAQCPFCGEQCDIAHEHDSEVKHRTAIHRPACIRGYTHDRQMEADYCPCLVVTDKRFSSARTGQNPYPYKDYQMFYPDWSIPPDCTSQDSLYWKLFVARYKDNLARYYGGRPPQVPSSWLNITKEEWKKQLQRVYYI